MATIRQAVSFYNLSLLTPKIGEVLGHLTEKPVCAGLGQKALKQLLNNAGALQGGVFLLLFVSTRINHLSPNSLTVYYMR